MPYQWRHHEPDGRAALTLWPYRSLPRKGFVIFIAATAGMLALPLLATLGTAILWMLLPFLAAAIGGVWWALQRSYRDGTLTETLTLAPDRLSLIRRGPDGDEKTWQANPYWVSVQLYPTKGRVPFYLTLKAEGREVELGAFLSEEERKTLAEELRRAIVTVTRPVSH